MQKLQKMLLILLMSIGLSAAGQTSIELVGNFNSGRQPLASAIAETLTKSLGRQVIVAPYASQEFAAAAVLESSSANSMLLLGRALSADGSRATPKTNLLAPVTPIGRFAGNNEYLFIYASKNLAGSEVRKIQSAIEAATKTTQFQSAAAAINLAPLSTQSANADGQTPDRRLPPGGEADLVAGCHARAQDILVARQKAYEDDPRLRTGRLADMDYAHLDQQIGVTKDIVALYRGPCASARDAASMIELWQGQLAQVFDIVQKDLAKISASPPGERAKSCRELMPWLPKNTCQ